MTNPELGARRRCLTCNAAFFDLNRAPILCPKCSAVFTPVEIAHSPPRRVYVKTPRQDPVVSPADEGVLITSEADEDQEPESEREAIDETAGEPDVA